MDAPPPTPAPDPSAWPPAARLALAGCLVMAGALLVGYTLGLTRAGTRPLTLEAYKVDLNAAEPAELDQLPGIGPAKAQQIVNYRDQHGAFQSTADLAPAVGAATAARVQQWTTLAPGMAPAVPKKGELTGPINVNTATLEELQRLPGIGPKMGQRILDERAKGPFRTVEELRRVSGIGVKTLEKLRPLVTVVGE